MSAKKTIKKKSEELTAEQWKEIATALAQNVYFALQFLAPQGGGAGVIYTPSTGKSIHWKERFADSLELTGMKIDREIMHAMSLPKRERVKRIKEIEAERAKKKDTP